MQNSHPPIRATLLGATCLALQPLLLNAISLPVMAYIIHRMGASGYGQWMVATSLLSLCAVLSNLGLRGAFIRSVATDRISGSSQLAEQLSLRIALAILAAVTAVSVCHLLGYSGAIVCCAAIGGIGLIVTAFSATLADFMQAFHRIKTVALVNFTSGLLLTIISLMTAAVTTSPVKMAAAYLTGPIISLLLLMKCVASLGCPITFHWNLSRFRQLFARSRFFTAQQLLALGSTQAESLILPRLVGVNQFGLFAAGALLPTRLTAIADGFCTATYPTMSQACAGGASGCGRSMMFRYVAIAAAAGVAIATALSLGAGPICWILFPRYSEPFMTVLRITAWSLPFMAVESVMGYALNAAGKDAEQSKASFPAAIVSIAISISLVTTLGIIGASFSMLLRPAVRTAFLAPLFRKTFRTDLEESPREDTCKGSRIYPQLILTRKAG